ncbi:MAG: flagellar hook capping FlgD N-terminal domain-containing protein [Alphaproteobacteria bacterium]|nr:flagellar hook capping FlgD N-terminal domain-containing protein [Alphaproteobacteria bacterium]
MSTTDAITAQQNTILQNYLSQQSQTIANSNANSNTNTQGIAGNFNTFLKILMTQLKHQDPTNATDTNQFTQELVQFAGVEQQLNTNSNLQTLINMQKTSGGLASTISYIGKYVEVPTSNALPLQNGKANLAYKLPAGVQTVTVNVIDSTGKTVANLTGSKQTGMNYISWDGKGINGDQLPDGAYRFQLTAKKPDGTSVSVTDIRALGLVTAVQSHSDGTIGLLLGNGTEVSSASVGAVYDSNNLPPPTTTTGT